MKTKRKVYTLNDTDKKKDSLFRGVIGSASTIYLSFASIGCFALSSCDSSDFIDSDNQNTPEQSFPIREKYAGKSLDLIFIPDSSPPPVNSTLGPCVTSGRFLSASHNPSFPEKWRDGFVINFPESSRWQNSTRSGSFESHVIKNVNIDGVNAEIQFKGLERIDIHLGNRQYWVFPSLGGENIGRFHIANNGPVVNGLNGCKDASVELNLQN